MEEGTFYGNVGLIFCYVFLVVWIIAPFTNRFKDWTKYDSNTYAKSYRTMIDSDSNVTERITETLLFLFLHAAFLLVMDIAILLAWPLGVLILGLYLLYTKTNI